jgi:hypothetical protein
MRHLDVEQARALRAKYPDWPRWKQREELDVLDSPTCSRGRCVVLDLPDDAECHLASDCTLLPTVGDLLDLAVWNWVVNLGCDGEMWAARTLGPCWHEANTPLAALYAALMGGE